MQVGQLGRRLGWAVLVVLLTGAVSPAATPAGGNPPDFGRADLLIETAVDRGNIPGAVLLVGRGDTILYRQAYGSRSIRPGREPMTADTVFDLASLSKPVGCATSVMLLAERGKLNVKDTVARYLPAFASNGKDKITIEQLLLHRGGLIADNPISDYANDPDDAIKRVMDLTPVVEPGTKFIYT